MTDREALDALVAAVEPVMGTLNYMIGPGARTAVSFESELKFWRVRHALCRAKGLPCLRCNDIGVDKFYVGAHRCALADEPGHPLVYWTATDPRPKWAHDEEAPIAR